MITTNKDKSPSGESTPPRSPRGVNHEPPLHDAYYESPQLEDEAHQKHNQGEHPEEHRENGEAGREGNNEDRQVAEGNEKSEVVEDEGTKGKGHNEGPTEDDCIFGIGRFAETGMTFKEVATLDSAFCNWALGQSTPQSPTLEQFVKYLKNDFDDGNVKMQIGKHSGKTFREVFTEYPDYCDWARKQHGTSGQLHRFINFCLHEEGKTKMGFGKYSDLTYNCVVEKHPSYCRWVETDTHPGNCQPFNRFSKWLEDYHFHHRRAGTPRNLSSAFGYETQRNIRARHE